MSTLITGIALATSMVTSTAPEGSALENFLSTQIQHEMVVMKQEMMQNLNNEIANATYQFSLDQDSVRGTVTIKDLETNTAE